MTVCLLSVTHSKADLKWEKGDNAIYAEPSVAGFPIKYRSKKKKKKQEGDKTQNREVVKQREREHLWDLAHKEGS